MWDPGEPTPILTPECPFDSFKGEFRGLLLEGGSRSLEGRRGALWRPTSGCRRQQAGGIRRRESPTQGGAKTSFIACCFRRNGSYLRVFESVHTSEKMKKTSWPKIAVSTKARQSLFFAHYIYMKVRIAFDPPCLVVLRPHVQQTLHHPLQGFSVV